MKKKKELKEYTVRALCRNDYETSVESESEDKALDEARANDYWQEITPGGYDCEYVVVDESGREW